MAGFQVSANLKNKNAMKVLISKVAEEQAELVRAAAKTMLEVATSHTPKYSGAATEGWRVTFDKEAANSVGTFSTTGFLMRGDIPEPVYEGGIHDPAAAGLNAKVSSRVIHINKAAIAKRIAAGQSVSLYLYNTQPYAQVWLQDMSLTNLLREVNKDYWTMSEINNAIRLRLKNVKRDFDGGMY